MPIYNKNGDLLPSAYGKNGIALTAAYDLDGTVIFPDGPQPSDTIKVMTYNVGQWYIGTATNVPADKDAEYYALQNGMIERANPDILFLCEYFDQFSKTGRTAASMLDQYFPYRVNYGGSGGYFGRAICSKYPISNYQRHGFGDGTSNYYDSCTITVEGKEITAIVTHLNYSASSQTTRLAQTSTLLNYLRTLNTFICGGDWNLLDCKSTSGSDYIDVIEPILNDGFHSANCTDFGFLVTYSDQPIGTWNGCLDDIVTSGNIEITGASVDTTKLTDSINDKVDHMPLIAELNISGV